jgi:hypothetical protein
LCILIWYRGLGFQEGGSRDEVAKVDEFEAGPYLGSMSSLQKTEKAKFGKILSKTTGFYQAAENKQLNRA